MPPATKTAAAQNAQPAGGGSADSAAAPDFETALEELERIVAGMESGDMTLEQSLAAHKRGLELAQFCQTVLARAQQQVKILEDNALRALDDQGPSS
jgi:exodeoxyribonuclease VII small subunit